jgi:hypothetical protein
MINKTGMVKKNAIRYNAYPLTRIDAKIAMQMQYKTTIHPFAEGYNAARGFSFSMLIFSLYIGLTPYGSRHRFFSAERVKAGPAPF